MEEIKQKLKYKPVSGKCKRAQRAGLDEQSFRSCQSYGGGGGQKKETEVRGRIGSSEKKTTS